MGLCALLLLNWMIPPDPKSEDGNPGALTNFKKVLRYSPALAGLAIGLFSCAANEVINLVFGVWMEDSFGLQIAALGAAAAVIGFAELAGESLVGVWVDRLGKPRAIMLGLVANSLVALTFPYFGQTLPGAVAGLFLFYLSFEFALVSTIPMMLEILPNARATMMAINISAVSLGRALGSSVAPTLYDWGIAASAGAAVVLNMLALLALRWARQQDS